MAIRRDIIIKSANTLGELKNTTYSHVNPELTNAQIDEVARAIQGLSKNSYLDTIRIETESITEALAE